MHNLRIPFRLGFLAIAIACAPVATFAQVTPPVPAYPTPYNPFLGEHVGIPAWEGQCPAPAFDREQAPQLRQVSFTPGEHSPQQDVYVYELTYRMVTPDLCFSAPAPAGFSHDKIDVGAFPQGHHEFVVKGVTDDDAVYVQYDVNIYAGPTDSLRDDVTGAWFAPEQSGRGVSAIRTNGVTMVYWATHDADGNPAWALLTDNAEDNEHRNVIEGTAIYTHGDPLAPGAATLESAPWGEMRFTYERCGHALLEWDAVDPALGEGSLEMVQALLPSGIDACDVENDPNSVVAERIED